MLTRGLPGSGKTTWASRLVAVKNGTWARVNRDETRAMLFLGETHGLTVEEEQQVTAVQEAQVRGLLQAGISVVVDDTNLNVKSVRRWMNVATKERADFQHKDFDVTLEVAIQQAKQRADEGGRAVPEAAIRRMHNRYLKKGFPPFPEVVLPPVEPYVPKRGPEIFIVDIDGTVTLGPHERGPFEWHKVGQDLPNKAVIDVVKSLSEFYQIIFVSGRSEECRVETERWLLKHDLWTDKVLYMRPAKDHRPDNVIKQEIFDAKIRNRFKVRGVLDDRDQVVRFWRSIGLTCLQVAEGNF